MLQTSRTNIPCRGQKLNIHFWPFPPALRQFLQECKLAEPFLFGKDIFVILKLADQAFSWLAGLVFTVLLCWKRQPCRSFVEHRNRSAPLQTFCLPAFRSSFETSFRAFCGLVGRHGNTKILRSFIFLETAFPAALVTEHHHLAGLTMA